MNNTPRTQVLTGIGFVKWCIQAITRKWIPVLTGMILFYVSSSAQSTPVPLTDAGSGDTVVVKSSSIFTDTLYRTFKAPPERKSRQAVRKLSGELSDKLNPSKSFSYSGRLSAQVGGYQAWGQPNRRDRLTWLLSGNITLKYMDIVVPLSVTVSQQERTFLQPFNQYGLSPSYKWVTVHGGYRSLRYSDFTLNNHLFLGTGIDLNPELKKGWKLRFSGMWGILRRAVQESAIPGGANALPVYKRTGYAFKLGVEKNNSFIDFILFKAKDEVGSLKTAGEGVVLPEENLVFGIAGQQFFLKKKLMIKADFAGSAYTRDIRSAPLYEKKTAIFNNMGKWFTPRNSTHYDYAVKTEVAYHGKTFSTGIAYQRISGDYRSMGTYFFQNDLEDLTANFNVNFNKGKASISGNAGVQRTNLKEEKTSSNKRFIASLNYAHNIGQKLSINLNVSNYTSYIQQVRDAVSDSLNLYQITQNYSVGINYRFGRFRATDNSIFASANFQQARERQAYEISNTPTNFLTTSVGHMLSLPDAGFSLNTLLNLSLNTYTGGKRYNAGPSLNVSQMLFKRKVRLGYVFSYLRTFDTGNLSGNNLRNTLNITYRFARQHQIVTGVYHYSNLPEGNQAGGKLTELRGDIRYEFTF